MTARDQVTRLAGTAGLRRPLARGRDRLVELLSPGFSRSLAARHNQIDDARLKLLMAFSLRADANGLDVGAHRGAVLADLVRLCPDGHHLAYEPLPHLAAQLAARFPTVDVRQGALSNVDGESTFVHVTNFPALSGLQRRAYPAGATTEIITVRTERLDSHLPPGWLPSFVKIDVEGATAEVIEGGMDTIRSAQPLVAFERGPAPGEVYDLLCRDAGLRIFDMDGHGPFSRGQFLDNPEKRFNWMAHP